MRGTTRARRWISQRVPPLNFIILHYFYFIGVSLVASIIFWGASARKGSISYTDSLFLVVSAMTLTGLNTVNLSTMNTFQQFILFSLTILGSAILVSIVVVHARRKTFEHRFHDIVEEDRKKRRARSGTRRRLSFSRSGHATGPEVDGIVVRGRAIPTEETTVQDAKSPTVGTGTDPTTAGRDEQHDSNSGVMRETSQSQRIPLERWRSRGAESELGSTRRITFAPTISPARERSHRHLLSMQGIGALPHNHNHPKRTDAQMPISPSDLPRLDESHVAGNDHDFLSSIHIGRNSQFSHLSTAERRRLGGVEYRALRMLALIVPLYFVLWQAVSCISLGAYIAGNRARTTLTNGLNPWWVGAFNAVSAFNNSGMSLLDANMTAFQTADYMLITMGLLMLAGNTCYPVFLRLVIWTLWKLSRLSQIWTDYQTTLRFLLDHPRRCYTNLFPSRHTWWLLLTLIGLNGTDWIAFEILNIGNSAVTSLPSGARALDGLFQALAVRSGGFYVVNIASLRVGLLILYVIMMYISVYPVVITMRNSNVYEERSLGIYSGDAASSGASDEKTPETAKKGKIAGHLHRQLSSRFHPHSHSQMVNAPSMVESQTQSHHPTPFPNHGHSHSHGEAAATETRGYFIRQQLRSQLSHDTWWIALAVLFITITETASFEAQPAVYSVFNILFEVVSAYGNVGISIGLPNQAYSFSGGWHCLSKLILCAVMLRGRHRGLPVAIDRAVLLPGEHLGRAEEEDAWIRHGHEQTEYKESKESRQDV